MKEMIVGRYYFILSENNIQHTIPEGLFVHRLIKKTSHENNSENTGTRTCYTWQAKTFKVGWWSINSQKTEAFQPVKF